MAPSKSFFARNFMRTKWGYHSHISNKHGESKWGNWRVKKNLQQCQNWEKKELLDDGQLGNKWVAKKPGPKE